jgi:queuosine precursor transporter
MTAPTLAMPRSLFVFSVFYGGMVPLGGFLGAKQVAVGPLAVEAGIFPFLTLIAVSSAIAQLHGKTVANRLVYYGFIPLVIAILLSFLVLQLPTDPGMYEPAKDAFPIIVGQSWRMMAAGILAYGTSVTLNIWIFARLAGTDGRFAEARGMIGDLMIGQMIAKIVLSIVVVPLVIALVVRIGKRLDA